MEGNSVDDLTLTLRTFSLLHTYKDTPDRREKSTPEKTCCTLTSSSKTLQGPKGNLLHDSLKKNITQLEALPLSQSWK